MYAMCMLEGEAAMQHICSTSHLLQLINLYLCLGGDCALGWFCLIYFKNKPHRAEAPMYALQGQAKDG